MKKRRLTQPLIRRIQAVTDSLYYTSVLDVFNIPASDTNTMYDMVVKLRNIAHGYTSWNSTPQEYDALLESKDKVNSLYLEKMIALPTKTLNDILFLHDRGRPVRAPRTIEAITSELARRSLLDDSSQSDTKYQTENSDDK